MKNQATLEAPKFRQPLADIMLQHNNIGSCLPLKNVTPAELMLLIGMHHKNCGKDPVLTLKEIPEDNELKKLSELQTELKARQTELETIMSDVSVTEEIRARRQESCERKIDKIEHNIEAVQAILSIRMCEPADEKSRLKRKYMQKTVDKFFPNPIPSLPVSFEQARQIGIGINYEEKTWLVGSEAKAA